MSKKKYILLVAVALGGLLLSLYAGNRTPTPSRKDEIAKASGNMPLVIRAKVKSSVGEKGKVENITLPYRRDGQENEVLDFTFQIDYLPGQSTLFQITPDDCIELMEANGKPVTLVGKALENRCNWQKGFQMDWKAYLKPGLNDVHMVIRNRGGWEGLYFAPVPQH